jgi:hypothetical protein
MEISKVLDRQTAETENTKKSVDPAQERAL